MRFCIMNMKSSIPAFDTAMRLCELRHGAYAKTHQFEFWLWAFAALFAVLTVRVRDSVPTPESDADLRAFRASHLSSFRPL
jgi:hypothetical protein